MWPFTKKEMPKKVRKSYQKLEEQDKELLNKGELYQDNKEFREEAKFLTRLFRRFKRL